jgi:ribonuclease HI
MSKPTLTIYTDGASRGNPGPAAYAYIISQEGCPDIAVKKAFGKATNNVAEYTALIEALEHAAKLGAGKVHIYSDSEFMVKQLRGENRVKHPDMKELYDEAKSLEKHFEQVTYNHVPRAQNSKADRLCNEALDGDKPPAPAPSRKKSPVPAERKDAVRADALQCLRDAATAWRLHDPRAPTPDQVWEQIWSVLEEHGIVR